MVFNYLEGLPRKKLVNAITAKDIKNKLINKLTTLKLNTNNEHERIALSMYINIFKKYDLSQWPENIDHIAIHPKKYKHFQRYDK